MAEDSVSILEEDGTELNTVVETSLRPKTRTLNVEEVPVVEEVPIVEEEPVVVSDSGVLNTPEERTAGLYRMPFGKQEFLDLWEVYTQDAVTNENSDSAAQGFASQLVKSLSYDTAYQGKMDYNSLRLGTAPILAELGIKDGKGLTDEQIIEMFAENENGERIIANPAAIEGLKRRALGGVGGGAAFFGGMKAGNVMVSGLPPNNWITGGIRLGFPVLTGIAAYAGVSFAGDEATELMMGEEPIIIPGTKTAYEVGKAVPDAATFLFTPWVAGIKGINIGGKATIEGINKFIGPILSPSGVAKIPLPTKAVAYVEGAVNRMGQAAFSNPFKTAFIEAGAGGASLYGTKLAEDLAPDNPWVRFGFEAGMGMSGAIGADVLANRLPFALNKTYNGIYNLVTKKKKNSDLFRNYGLSETELDDAGNFIIEQLEKNNENPAELYKLINDPSFDKFLIDEDGNKIQLDAATRAASITLLALQNKFLTASPEFGKDAGSKMQSSIDALRRGLLAMYADGSKEALGDAAIVQTSLFEAVLESQLATSVKNMQVAINKVRPDGDDVDLTAANKIFDILDGLYTSERGNEQSLWRSIPKDITLNSFINEEGTTGATPNFVSTWNKLFEDEAVEIQEIILKSDELGFLNKFVERATDELNLKPGDAGSLPVLPEKRRLVLALDKIAGSNNENLPSKIMSEMNDSGASPEEVLARLRSEASAKRGKFSTPRSREVANALDAQANFLVAQRRQSLELAEAAGKSGTEVEGLNAYEIVRLRGRALAMGKRLAAANLDDESRIAYKMADAMLADLNGMEIGASQAYDTARSFSRAFNQVFTRAYAGEILGTKKNGAPQISIETLANTMMKGDSAFMRASQLDGVANFQVTQSLTNLLKADTSDLLSSTASKEFQDIGSTLLKDFQQNLDPNTGVIDNVKMRDWYGRNRELITSVPGLNTRIAAAMNGAIELKSAEETLVRTIRANTLNPDGSLNTTALSNWRNNVNNERLVKMFPQLEADLNSVEKARVVLTEVKKDTAAELTKEKNGLGLYELLPDHTTNPTTTISLALSQGQNTPFTIMNKYMRMINSVGEDGFTVIAENSPNKGMTWTKQDLVDGLRTTIFESVFNASEGKVFRPDVAYNRLFGKHPNADISTAEWMKANDLITPERLDDTRKFLRKMAEIQAFTMKAKPGDTDEFYKDIGEGIKLIAAMAGSAAGTNLKRGLGFEGSSGDLVVAGRSARFGQNLVEKYMAEVPSHLQSSRVAIVLENEELLRLVLKTGKTAREKENLARQLAEAFEQNYIVSPTRRTVGFAIQNVAPETDLEGDATSFPPVVPTNNGGNSPVTVPATAPIRQITPPVQLNPNRATPPKVETLNPTRQGSLQNSGPVDRERFAALFPNDSTTQLMKSGIGSLA